jgi:hypothetical protein
MAGNKLKVPKGQSWSVSVQETRNGQDVGTARVFAAGDDVDISPDVGQQVTIRREEANGGAAD